MADTVTLDKQLLELMIHPAYTKLLAEVDMLRNELADIITERDVLLYQTCVNIETEYMLQLGHIEYRIFQNNLHYRETKRKYELIQSRINRKEPVNLYEIEQILKEEFMEYEKKKQFLLHKINNAFRNDDLDRLSKEETKELRTLYRKIMKHLHPDLHPDLKKEEMELFQNAVNAYRDGDLDRLRIISFLMEPDSYDCFGKSKSDLDKQRDSLRAYIDIVNKDIQRIQNEYPYTMKSLLEDQVRLYKRKKELYAEESLIAKKLEMIKKKLEELMKECMTS